MRTRFAFIVAIAAMPLTIANAQSVAPRNVISIQPLNAILTWFSAEFERSVSKSVTWGIGATYWDIGDASSKVKYSSEDLKLRYYPNNAALFGFSVGGTVGFSQAKGADSPGTDQSVSAPSFGVLLEYQWIMGEKKNFALALGAGAKTLMVSEDKLSSSDFVVHYPTARVSIGYVF